MDAAALDPDVRRMLDALRRAQAPDFADLTPALARSAFARAVARLSGPPTPVAGVDDLEVHCRSGPRRMRRYLPAQAASGAALLWLHGGGFVFGDVESYDPLCRALCALTETSVFSLDYRLAPEHPFPAAFDDAADAWTWLQSRAPSLALDPCRISIGGDSAGGMLALATALATRRATQPRGMLLAYPQVSFQCTTDSHRRYASGFLLTRRTIEWCYTHCLGLARPAEDDLRLQPLQAASLATLPPTTILLAGHDPLHDEGSALAADLARAGVPIAVVEFPSMVHGFLSYPAAIPGAPRALRAFTDAFARQTAEAADALRARG